MAMRVAMRNTHPAVWFVSHRAMLSSIIQRNTTMLPVMVSVFGNSMVWVIFSLPC